MSPPRAVPAEETEAPPAESPERIGQKIQAYLKLHPEASLLEDGKVVFELNKVQSKVRAEHGRCTLEVWSGERNLVRTVVAATERKGCLRLSTRRFGHAQTKMLLIYAAAPRREPARREPARQQYVRLLQRVLVREFADWHPEGFRAAMDLERSFGPAYARGSLVRGNEAWAVIGAGATESQATIDGILTLGILWLHHRRERGDGRRLYKGLRVIVPRGAAMVTLARLPWMNGDAAQWELLELDEPTEELVPRDAADQGNLLTRLVHHPDQAAAHERFGPAIEQVMALVPAGEAHRVQQRLRSGAELAFLLHGLEFARARISLAPGRFAHTLEITVGVGPAETPLTEATQPEVAERVTELFARRAAAAVRGPRGLRPHVPGKGIGVFTGRPLHPRTSRGPESHGQQDPLYRAAPERWLESVLRDNLAPLTRSLAANPMSSSAPRDEFANDVDPDTRGNRAVPFMDGSAWPSRSLRDRDRLIPRFDPRFVYAQVPAIAGAGDRGMLDLLGVTQDGRLAVIELKASDDLQLALQGLDYWIRVRHHHNAADAASGLSGHAGNDLQRHGYFREIELSPLPPRLYLVAPALHVHPATETVLRYLSPRVEWTLLALDERWRQEVRVVWRKSGGSAADPGSSRRSWAQG